MTNETEKPGGQFTFPWRIVGWGVAALLLLLPLVARAPWTPSDFLVAAVLLGGLGLAFEIIVRTSTDLAYRAAAALAVVAAFLTVWVNGAVGMIGSEGNSYNLIFGIVLLIALIGAILARFEPVGISRAMVVTAIAQTAAGAAGLATDTLGAILSVA